MSSTQETKKKPDKNNYVRTFREGAVAASVFRRVAPGGFEYLDFNLSRAWKNGSSKEGYSQNFFPKNCEALHEVIDRACEFIEAESLAVTAASGERRGVNEDEAA
jgi:hypothetical protein